MHALRWSVQVVERADLACLVLQDNRAGKSQEPNEKDVKDDKVGKGFWSGKQTFAVIVAVDDQDSHSTHRACW